MMIRLLDDYTFGLTLSYRGHQLHYTSGDGNEYVFSGIVAAAVLCTLLADTDEGDARGITLDTPEQREDFFNRYEREVRRDNGGWFPSEVLSLRDVYIEVAGEEEILVQICRNDRLLDLAYRLIMEYMDRLVHEEVGQYIYDKYPWRAPFAQWLYEAGFVESYRQHLLDVDWTDHAGVYAFAEMYQPGELPDEPMFVFSGLEADDLLNRYFEWRWSTAKREAAMMPDAEVQLEQKRVQILAEETSDRCVEDDLRELPTETQKLFRKWISRWTAFVTDKLASSAQDSFPQQQRQTRVEQVLFPDATLTCPEPNKYTQVRDYIHDRCRYDDVFRDYYRSHTLSDFCEQLTLLFGWYVNPNSLGKCLKRKKK